MNGQMSGCAYVQAMTNQTPKFDNDVRKKRRPVKRKKKKGERE